MVSVRERPNCMKMVRKDDPPFYVKRMPVARHCYSAPQRVDVANESIASSVSQIDSEKVTGAGNAKPAIIGHG